VFGELPIPSHTDSGIRFIGWFTATIGGEEISNVSFMNSPNNITLYARYVDKIDISETDITVSTEIYTYDGTVKGVTLTIRGNAPTNNYSVQYRQVRDGNGIEVNGDYTNVAIDAGTYHVRVIRESDPDGIYNEFTKDFFYYNSANLTINQATIPDENIEFTVNRASTTFSWHTDYEFVTTPHYRLYSESGYILKDWYEPGGHGSFEYIDSITGWSEFSWANKNISTVGIYWVEIGIVENPNYEERIYSQRIAIPIYTP
jgi:hypothetical protein